MRPFSSVEKSICFSSASTSYTFSSLELHSVSTVLSGLMRYTADFSTPLTSTTGVNCVLTCGVEAAGCAGAGLPLSGGLISFPGLAFWASTVMVVVTDGTPPAVLDIP